MSGNRPIVKLTFRNKETKQTAECGVGFANDFDGCNMRFAEETKEGEFPVIKFERALELARQGKGYINLVANGKNMMLVVAEKTPAPF